MPVMPNNPLEYGALIAVVFILCYFGFQGLRLAIDKLYTFGMAMVAAVNGLENAMQAAVITLDSLTKTLLGTQRTLREHDQHLEQRHKSLHKRLSEIDDGLHSQLKMQYDMTRALVEKDSLDSKRESD